MRADLRLSARRSSSLSPPQTPESWPLSSAHCRHGSITAQRWHTRFASSICDSAGPVALVNDFTSYAVCRDPKFPNLRVIIKDLRLDLGSQASPSGYSIT